MSDIRHGAPEEEDGWEEEADGAPGAGQTVDDVSLRIAPDATVASEGGECRVVISVSAEGTPELARSTSGHWSRAPVDICCVVDISGSMGTEASLENQAASQSTQMCVLDVVKHAVKTVMHILKSEDRLALVVFDDKAETVFGLTNMTEEGREQSKQALDGLRPRGQTNLWEGIRLGMEALQEPPGERQKTLLVLTDGQPNCVPAKGHLSELKEYKDSHPGFRFRLNTFGFGYDLDSQLLSDLAVEGHGTYAFIPDAAILGTVFVDSVANVLSTKLQNATLHLLVQEGAAFTGPVLGAHAVTEASWGKVVSIGPLQFEQTREVVVPMHVPVGAAPYLEAVLIYQDCDGKERRISSQGTERSACREAAAAALRSETVSIGYAAILAAADGNCDDALQTVTDLAARLDEASSTEGLSEHLTFKADVQGRMVKALTGEDRFNRWGKHYLRALLRAHQLQTCTNFMDPGLQVYGGQRFKEFRKEGDTVFVSIPAPRPAKDETGIPCEICGASIPFGDYADHAATCGRAPARPGPSPEPAPARGRSPSPDMNQYYAGSGGG
eukprot:TRINITY_DN75374_c0_g1_i1.p1 TRINITY_DN75374_c0_g1~~TRINITY_DN75374_c0_g1_i1.p1  ORF type:complete len:556 (+),score=99.45 TRINITY_DN75374_c0_g1_i1:62-1729(+)